MRKFTILIKVVSHYFIYNGHYSQKQVFDENELERELEFIEQENNRASEERPNDKRYPFFQVVELEDE